MIISAFDPSYSNFGVLFYDTDLNQVVEHFNIKPSEKDKDKYFSKIGYDTSIKINLRKDKYAKILWENERLANIFNKLSEYKYDAIVVENQWQTDLSETLALIKLLGGLNNLGLKYYTFYPKEWRKIAFNNGAIDKEEIKRVLQNDYGEDIIKKWSSHEYECIGMIKAYLIKKELYDIKTFLKGS